MSTLLYFLFLLDCLPCLFSFWHDNYVLFHFASIDRGEDWYMQNIACGRSYYFDYFQQRVIGTFLSPEGFCFVACCFTAHTFSGVQRWVLRRAMYKTQPYDSICKRFPINPDQKTAVCPYNCCRQEGECEYHSNCQSINVLPVVFAVSWDVVTLP